MTATLRILQGSGVPSYHTWPPLRTTLIHRNIHEISKGFVDGLLCPKSNA